MEMITTLFSPGHQLEDVMGRTVDPTAFSESVDFEFLPRGVEDAILDERIGAFCRLHETFITTVSSKSGLFRTSVTHTLSPHHETTLQCHFHSPLLSPADPNSSMPALQQSLDEESFAVRKLEESSPSKPVILERQRVTHQLLVQPPSLPIFI
jgi:hypothetical protein